MQGLATAGICAMSAPNGVASNVEEQQALGEFL
jgi:hypothetical protein